MMQRILLLPALVIVTFCTLSLCTNGNGQFFSDSAETQVETVSVNADSLRMAKEFPTQIAAVEKYLTANPGKYSKNYAVLIDMKIPSNHYRFFLVDLRKDSIVQKGLVAHGSGSETNKADSLIFSNTPNSYMTSLGIYKFGVAYQGSFGKSYRLHGLDKTNSKAFERAVVFHSYSYVPTEEQDSPIMNSLGCPMVSPDFFDAVDVYIKKEKLPMLMKIYY